MASGHSSELTNVFSVGHGSGTVVLALTSNF
jgi:hypothetical protein